MIDNMEFWKTAKTFFARQVKSEKNTLVYEDKIITNDDENAKISNSFF